MMELGYGAAGLEEEERGDGGGDDGSDDPGVDIDFLDADATVIVDGPTWGNIFTSSPR